MAVDYASLYADQPTQRNHWWWRPGWGVGTRFLAFHITLDGQDELQALTDNYAAALQPFSSLDPIPRQWRHITLQGLGHVEDVPHRVVDQVLTSVTERLKSRQPITSYFRRAAILREAIALPPDNPADFTRLRSAVRAGILDACGSVSETEDGFRAHTSVAYSNREAEAQPIRAALDSLDPAPTAATFASVDLIEMHRDSNMYEWSVRHRVSLG